MSEDIPLKPIPTKEITTRIDEIIAQLPMSDDECILECSPKTGYALRRVGVCTFTQLKGWTAKQLLRIRNFGRLNLLELLYVLQHALNKFNGNKDS